MAEEVKKQPAEEAKTEPKKSGLFSKKNIIILSVIIAILAGGAFIALKKFTAKKHQEAEKTTETAKTIHSFDTLVVNISGTNGSRYLKVAVAVEIPQKSEIIAEMESRSAEFMDILNSIFSSRTIEQVVDVNERENTKRDIRDRFNEKLSSRKKENGDKELVTNVFFSEYVAQ